MPKAARAKRNGAAPGSKPYEAAASKMNSANNIFRMNTDIGQHVLKNPLVAQKIVEKADLKQSDVCYASGRLYIAFLSYVLIGHYPAVDGP